MVDSPIPKMDFSFIGNLPGNYEAGQQIGRERAARAGLAKCQPGDFDCMSRVLMSLDPAEGVKFAQLQNQLQHQTFQEDLASKQLAAQEENNRILQASRSGREARSQELYDAPLKALQAGVPGYAAARDALRSAPVGGVTGSLFGGGPIKEIKGFAAKVGAANRLTGQALKAYIDEHTPSAYDFSTGHAAEIFGSLEADAKGLGFDVPAYVEKTIPPPAANSPAAAGRGAPGLAAQPPVTVSPPAGEAASAAEGPAARPVPTVNIRLVPGTNIQIPPALANHPRLAFDTISKTFIDKDTGARFNLNGEPVSGQP